ncbi:hypothetical protein [Paraflavitalea pollutisoli]|uniref:hypothetical protein n=1 Tax=Paraflavitalea pollutisoli TaxID=3034143 RepID=UPI0023EC9749|nr:hypothetical protein [Paraflavitalea sp. H1-2-19X]
MKAIVKFHSALLLVSAITLGQPVLAANDPLVEKTKTISKTYPVSSSDQIDLSNSFGEMKISTWNKNEVKVDIVITTEAGTEERAQELLDAISVNDGKSGNRIYFKTKVGDNSSSNKRGKGEKQSFRINYTVFLPDNANLDATNEFGPMSIGDFNGKGDFTNRFGSFTAGKLNNPMVNVEFGKANIESINNGGNITIKFSRAIIGGMSGDIRASFEHCNGIKIKLNNDLKSIDVRNAFSPLYVDVPTNFSARYDVRTSFSKLKNNTSFSIPEEGEDDRGPKFDHRYNGSSGSGSANIKIKSEFKDVSIGHNQTFDVNSDDKKKAKDI